MLALSVVIAISFSSSPSVSPDNVTVDTTFDCTFTSDEDGFANVTWFVERVGSGWESWTADDVINHPLSAGSPSSVTAHNAASNASKDERWRCQVTLSNGTHSVVSNSTSDVLIINSLPDISYPEQSVVISQSEDSPYSDFAIATDADGDDIFWTFAYSGHDPIAPYSESSPFDFSINSGSGLMSFVVTNESQAGNHTIDVIAKDGSGDGRVRTVIFEVIPVNDSPEFGSLEFSCTENEV